MSKVQDESKVIKKKEKKVKFIVSNHSKDDNIKIDSDNEVFKSKNNLKESKKKKKMKQKIISKVESDSDNDMALNDDCDETVKDEQMEQDEEDTSDDADQLLSLKNLKKKLKKTKQEFISNNVESDSDVENEMALSDEEESIDEDMEDEDESNKRDDDLLPIERANKKLMKKKQKEE